jgi:hypothetical protein
MNKGDRVAFKVKYYTGDRTEYGTVTSMGGWFRSRRKVHIRVDESALSGLKAKYVERYADDVQVISPELDENGQPKLTYAYLASLAVTPAADHEDLSTDEVHGLDGAYHNSPLGTDIGLHIHALRDNWNETEPMHPVHVVYDGGKIAEVYPYGVVNRLDYSGTGDWREDLLRWGENAKADFAVRLLRDAGPMISRHDARLREGLE